MEILKALSAEKIHMHEPNPDGSERMSIVVALGTLRFMLGKCSALKEEAAEIKLDRMVNNIWWFVFAYMVGVVGNGTFASLSELCFSHSSAFSNLEC